VAATGQPNNACQIGFGPMTQGFTYATFNDLEDFKSKCDENTIGIMVEPVQGEGGVHPATKEFLQGLRTFCDENDILLLLDEVQAGWGRCGALMSHMNYDVKPDIVSMAKALGGDMVINTAGVTLAHGMEHPVSGLKDAVHGVGLAAIEPACVEATCRYNWFKFGKVSRLIGGLTAEDCGPRLRSLLKRLDLDVTLVDLGIEESDIPWLAENCQKVSAGNLANTPGKMFCNQASLEGLYRATLTGTQEDDRASEQLSA
jgi:hypothetical protein